MSLDQPDDYGQSHGSDGGDDRPPSVPLDDRDRLGLSATLLIPGLWVGLVALELPAAIPGLAPGGPLGPPVVPRGLFYALGASTPVVVYLDIGVVRRRYDWRPTRGLIAGVALLPGAGGIVAANYAVRRVGAAVETRA